MEVPCTSGQCSFQEITENIRDTPPKRQSIATLSEEQLAADGSWGADHSFTEVVHSPVDDALRPSANGTRRRQENGKEVCWGNGGREERRKQG